MSTRDRALPKVQTLLDADEVIKVLEASEIKPTRQEVKRDVKKSLALSVLGAPLGYTAIAQTVRYVWVIVTDKRLLLVEKNGFFGKNMVGKVLFSAPTKDLSTTGIEKLGKLLIVRNSQTDEEIVRLVFGLHNQAYENVKTAVS